MPPGGTSGADALPPVQHALNVEPGSIPTLRNAFSTALTKLDKQIELAVTEFRVRPWAGDPVSAEAAEIFNERSVSSGDSALEALQNYQKQLKQAMDSLDEVERQYRVIEGDNTGLMNKGGC
ncbi:transcriptional regulator [Lentzea tibetensis]|uniref:Transcriptional regulator n=1 Tax=Lentzea tibetensis TaxID=2591470 RepID=A0A563EMA2_9PSEU|nr:transcriptional regulator [Lentzea tibetensis]TWP48289.1 transcriptional regulator [Lentzea tibetensis]